MKKLEGILLKGCGFSILILLMFYLFAVSTNYRTTAIDFPTFSIILGFGFLISLATLILGIKSISAFVRILIHYATLLVSFFVIFALSGNIDLSSSAKVFAAISLFTAVYAIISLMAYALKRIVNLMDKSINRKNKAYSKAEEKKSTYKSLYSDK